MEKRAKERYKYLRLKCKNIFLITDTQIISHRVKPRRVKMRVLTRRIDESIRIGDDIIITVLKSDKKQVDLGISAPDDVAINREEVYKKKQN